MKQWRFEVFNRPGFADVQGAGDTTIAALSLALRAGGSLLEAAVIANAAAGAVRVTFWGALAMALTAGVGALFGTVV